MMFTNKVDRGRSLESIPFCKHSQPRALSLFFVNEVNSQSYKIADNLKLKQGITKL